jgi:hypothetical protein
MTVEPLTSSLVCVHVRRWFRVVEERFAVLTPHGWCWDKGGRAVCPTTAAAIRRQLERS